MATSTEERTDEMEVDLEDDDDISPPPEIVQTTYIDVQRWNSFRTAARASATKLAMLIEGTAEDDEPDMDDGAYDYDFDESSIEDLSRIENEARAIMAIAVRWRHNIQLRYKKRDEEEKMKQAATTPAGGAE